MLIFLVILIIIWIMCECDPFAACLLGIMFFVVLGITSLFSNDTSETQVIPPIPTEIITIQVTDEEACEKSSGVWVESLKECI